MTKKKAKAHSVYLFMNRNCMVFDKEGSQLPEYQRGITCYRVDKKIARAVAAEAKEFHISSFREWSRPITRRSFEYLLGLRTRKMDTDEAMGPPNG